MKTIAIIQKFGDNDYAIVDITLTQGQEKKLNNLLEFCAEGSTRGTLEEVLKDFKEYQKETR